MKNTLHQSIRVVNPMAPGFLSVGGGTCLELFQCSITLRSTAPRASWVNPGERIAPRSRSNYVVPFSGIYNSE